MGCRRHWASKHTVMELVPGVIAKGGAEGVLVIGTEGGLGIAVKSIDGSPRATTFVALEILRPPGWRSTTL